MFLLDLTLFFHLAFVTKTPKGHNSAFKGGTLFTYTLALTHIVGLFTL